MWEVIPGILTWKSWKNVLFMLISNDVIWPSTLRRTCLSYYCRLLQRRAECIFSSLTAVLSVISHSLSAELVLYVYMFFKNVMKFCQHLHIEVMWSGNYLDEKYFVLWPKLGHHTVAEEWPLFATCSPYIIFIRFCMLWSAEAEAKSLICLGISIHLISYST